MTAKAGMPNLCLVVECNNIMCFNDKTQQLIVKLPKKYIYTTNADLSEQSFFKRAQIIPMPLTKDLGLH